MGKFIIFDWRNKEYNLSLISIKKENKLNRYNTENLLLLRVDLHSEHSMNDLEKIIMRIMSSHIEEETLTQRNYDIYDTIPYPMPHKELVTKLHLISKEQFRLKVIGGKSTIIFWIFIKKIGILIVESKLSKQFKIISKTNLHIQDKDSVGIVTNKLENSPIFKQINIDDKDIKEIAKEFFFFLNR